LICPHHLQACVVFNELSRHGGHGHEIRNLLSHPELGDEFLSETEVHLQSAVELGKAADRDQSHLHGEGNQIPEPVAERAADGKRPGSWETVYGKIDAREKPEKAALRELGEETGLAPESLYNVTVSSFYLHRSNTIQMCITFAAFVSEDAEVTLSEEHQRFEWLSFDDACERFTWPREAHALRDARHLLGRGDAGPVEDVLRIHI